MRTEIIDQRRKFTAGMMLLSGVTHPAQMLFYGSGPEIRGPAMSGILFFFVGLFLLTRFRLALWVAIALPLMGGVGAIYRIVDASPTAFTYFHAAIDFVVVGLCGSILLSPHWRGDGKR
ncbi:MAG: hypothetical protein VCB25_06275 [Myxococcota bacterium]